MSKLRDVSDCAMRILSRDIPGGKPRRSPGRKAMAKELCGKCAQKPVHTMLGQVPEAIEQDKQFFQLFQISKDLEATVRELRNEPRPDLEAIQAARDAFNSVICQLRARWLELVPEDRPS